MVSCTTNMKTNEDEVLSLNSGSNLTENEVLDYYASVQTEEYLLKNPQTKGIVDKNYSVALSRYKKQTEDEIKEMPASVIRLMKFMVASDKIIKEKMHYKGLIKEYYENKITLDEIKKLYQETAIEVGFYDIWKELNMETEKMMQIPSKMVIKRNGTGTEATGINHNYLNKLVKGDVVVRLPGDSSGSSSSSGGLDVGHAGLWKFDGDPEPENEGFAVVISAWMSGADKYHNRAGVCYDYRRTWDDSNGSGKYGGFRVIEDDGTEASEAKREAAYNYAQKQYDAKKGYTLFGKWTEDAFTCTTIPYHAWEHQGIDIQHGWLISPIVAPWDIWRDDNLNTVFVLNN
jgi:hypothetical protein